jgi:hypothetical protein
MGEYREQERRDKADMAVVQAARRWVRAEVRKGNSASEWPGSQGCVLMGLLGSADRAPYWRRRASVAYRFPPQCQPRRDNRIIHLDPSTGHGPICQPAHQEIDTRCLYAYALAENAGTVHRVLTITFSQRSLGKRIFTSKLTKLVH